jgi:hypothetical protein
LQFAQWCRVEAFPVAGLEIIDIGKSDKPRMKNFVRFIAFSSE